MEPEDFARQFFDMWQDSFSNAMEDSTFNAKLLHLMEQSNVFWNGEQKKTNTAETNDPPYQQSAGPDDYRDGTVQELAERLEKCEQRIRVLEAIIRSEFTKVPDDRESRPPGERNARIQISKRAGSL